MLNDTNILSMINACKVILDTNNEFYDMFRESLSSNEKFNELSSKVMLNIEILDSRFVELKDRISILSNHDIPDFLTSINDKKNKLIMHKENIMNSGINVNQAIYSNNKDMKLSNITRVMYRPIVNEIDKLDAYSTINIFNFISEIKNQINLLAECMNYYRQSDDEICNAYNLIRKTLNDILNIRIYYKGLINGENATEIVIDNPISNNKIDNMLKNGIVTSELAVNIKKAANLSEFINNYIDNFSNQAISLFKACIAIENNITLISNAIDEWEISSANGICESMLYIPENLIELG